MKLPVLEGIIKRRMLVNFRVDPAVVQKILPAQFRPKLYKGFAVAGICLIRLEHIRPKHMPEFIGISSENAAHRIAVVWEENGEAREGVFIPRRDTGSVINQIAGGRLFPGEHHRAEFAVRETDNEISFSMKSDDGKISVKLEARITDQLQATSIFSSLEEASKFFEPGSLGFSVTKDKQKLDGIVLETKTWSIDALDVARVHSTFYSDENMFPKGSIEFDNALMMRNIAHEWHSAPSFDLAF
jgi:hypothetical protein